MEKTPIGSHRGRKHVVYTHPGEGFQFWNQSLSCFVTNSRKTFLVRWLAEHSLLHPSCRKFTVLKAVHSWVLSQSLQENLFDDTVPNAWKRHKLTHAAPKNVLLRNYLVSTYLGSTQKHVLLRNYLPGNICSDINGKPTRASVYCWGRAMNDNTVPDEWKTY